MTPSNTATSQITNARTVQGEVPGRSGRAQGCSSIQTVARCRGQVRPELRATQDVGDKLRYCAFVPIQRRFALTIFSNLRPVCNSVKRELA